jgi:hypothetical protein
MARYFSEEIGLETLLEQDADSITCDDDEQFRACIYMNEWRNFGGRTLSIVNS